MHVHGNAVFKRECCHPLHRRGRRTQTEDKMELADTFVDIPPKPCSDIGWGPRVAVLVIFSNPIAVWAKDRNEPGAVLSVEP